MSVLKNDIPLSVNIGKSHTINFAFTPPIDISDVTIALYKVFNLSTYGPNIIVIHGIKDGHTGS